MTAICNRKTLRTFLAALLVLCLAVSLSVVSALAEDTSANEVTATDPVSGALSGETATATEPAGSASATEAATSAASTAATSGSTASTAETKSAAEQKAETRRLINLIVGGVILAVLVVLAIVFRAKIPVWFKAIRSECGKIVWCPKDKLKKNAIVVVVIIVAIAVLIALLDIAFSTGIIELGKAVKNIGK